MTLEEMRIKKLYKLLEKLENTAKSEEEKDYAAALRWAIYELEQKS